jgi:uncharacterized protein (TIGR02453 family)
VKSAFPGFPQEGIDFFRKLQRNNRREWFQPRKPIFDATLKQPMRELVAALNDAMKSFAPQYVTDPDKAIFRIYRDTRFSKDKTPYKDHVAASFPRHDTPAGAGLYVAVSHKEVAIGGGIYMPSPDTLLAIRHHVAANYLELRKIVAKPVVRQLFQGLQGEQLTRVPKGFDRDHPAADLLRHKQFILYVELPPELATSPELCPLVVRHFRASIPFLEYLNAPLIPKRKPLLPKF